jgi:hypothetical protein
MKITFARLPALLLKPLRSSTVENDGVVARIRAWAEAQAEEELAERDESLDLIADIARFFGCDREWSNLHDHHECVRDAVSHSTPEVSIGKAREPLTDEIERLRALLWCRVLCGGCGKSYRYNRAVDPKGDDMRAVHYAAVPTCQGAEWERNRHEAQNESGKP